jgi:hypothetical protein
VNWFRPTFIILAALSGAPFSALEARTHRSTNIWLILPAWRCAFGTWRQSDAAASGGQPLTYAKLVDDYLSEAHRDHPGSGCAISALTGEIARSGKRTRALLTEEIRNAFQLIADLTPGQGRGTGEIGSNFNP